MHKHDLKDMADSSDPKVQKRIRTKYNLIRELVLTEESFDADIAVAIDIYNRLLLKEPYCNFVSSRDVRALFLNLDQILLLSRRFVAHLRECVPSYILDECDLSPHETDNQKKVIKDVESFIGPVILEYIPNLEYAYGTYCAQSQFQLNTFYRISSQGSPTIDRWLIECRNASKDLTKAWTLDALLIKPVQRLLKYPLLLSSMLEATDTDHPDYQLLKRALDNMQDTANRINSIEPETIQVYPLDLTQEPEEGTDQPTDILVQKDPEDYNVVMSRLDADPHCDTELEILMIQFSRKQRHITNLIKYLRGNISQIQRHFDSNSSLSHSWVNWSSVTDDAEYFALNAKNKVYRRYAMFSLPFTTSSSAHVSTNKLSRRVEDEVIDPLHETWLCYFNAGKAIEMWEKYHASYSKYVAAKAALESSDSEQPIDPITLAGADNFIKLHNAMKLEFPILFNKTEEMIDNCLIRFLSIQRDWFRIAVDSTSNVFSLTLADIRLTDRDPIVDTFHLSQVEDVRQTIDEDLAVCHFRQSISTISTNNSRASYETRHDHPSSASSLSSQESIASEHHTKSSAGSSVDESDRERLLSGEKTWSSQSSYESTSSLATVPSPSSSVHQLPNVIAPARSASFSSHHRQSGLPLTVRHSKELPKRDNLLKAVRRRSSLMNLTGWQKSLTGSKSRNNRLSIMNEV